MARAAISSANQASLSALPVASRVAVREHSRWIAARMMTSGSGTRSAVPMMRGDEAHVTTPFIFSRICGGSGKNRLVRDW